MNTDLLKKYDVLKKYLLELESVAVAFSSGVDSTFLLYAAREALGDKAIAVTATSPSFPHRERIEAEQFCKQLKIKQILFESRELEIPGYAENPVNRCYICKKGIFSKILSISKENGCKEVVEGSNLDDNGDYRPGMIAIAELNIKSPLRYAELTKSEIRELSAYFKLPTWDKPSYACLASRFPYGEMITEKKLDMVGKGEQLLYDLGFNQCRVRIHGDLARIELLPEDFERFMSEEIRDKVYKQLKDYGFSYISLDIRGYRMGSMNESILV